MVATGTELLLFAPRDLLLFGTPLGASRMTIYGAGFFFWAVASSASALTVALRRSAE